MITTIIYGTIFSSLISVEPVGLQEILENLEGKSPELQLQRLEAVALQRQSQSQYGKVLPELGVEGGGRSSREKEKRTDIFYYGYARYALSLGDIVSLRAAFNRSELSELSKQQASIRAQMSVIAIYYQVLSIQKQLDLKTNDLSLAEKQMSVALKRVDGGLATESDILEFKMHQQIIENDLLVLKRNFESSLKQLEIISGFSRSITEVREDFIFSEETKSFDEVWKIILAKNLELRRAKVDAVAATSSKTSAMGDFMPRLSAEAQYGKLMETDFIESKKNSWEIVGKLTIPIFNGSSSLRRFQEKSAEADRARLEAAQVEQRVQNEAQTLYTRLQELKVKLKGEEQNIIFAKKYFELVMSEYRRGVKNSPDVASATDKLFDAKWRLIETQIELSLGSMELLAMQGEGLVIRN